MFYSRIDPQQIQTKRLDADFYHPEYLEIESKLLTMNVNPLGEIGKFFAGPFGSKLPSNLYLDEGIPLFRVGNVGQFEVLTKNFAYLANSVHEELKSSEVLPGDLLIVKASVGEKICKVPEWIPKANITQHIIGVRPNGKFDIDYVSAFLFSKFGVKQLQRFALGSIIEYLGVTDAKASTVVNVNDLVQKYIGDKVRQAERLRDWAEKLEKKVEIIFNEQLAWNSNVLNVPSFGYIKIDELDSRLDLKYNSPQRLSTLRHSQKHKIKMDKLETLVDISAMIGWKGLTTEYYRNIGPWLLRGVEFNNGVIHTEDLVCVDEEKYLEQPQIHLAKNDIAFSKDGTIGKAIVIPDLPNRIAAGSTIARLRIKEKVDIDPYYLELSLAHEILQAQIFSFATGVAQPHITQEWIAQLQIPRIHCEADLSKLWKGHHESLNAAKRLINLSKFLVESLIEGQITENELIHAQKALEAGNTEPDEAILRRLKSDGLDGKGKPLFSDLEQLYNLLRQAEQDRE